jgi:hypothetical protein
MTVTPDDIPALTAQFRQGTAHLTNMAKGMEFPFDMTVQDPRRIHNMYVRNLVTCYFSKFSELSTSILDAIEQSNFLIYALCGRALIGTVATLRYYVTEEYKPLLDKGTATGSVDLKKLVAIDDRHLRGTRFNWESFIFRDYAKLREGVLAQLEAKREKKGLPAAQDIIIAPQVNVLTCVEKWARDEPGVLIAYNLFCDLVHPNIGSAFLVASASSDGKLFFSRFRGTSIGKEIFVQSFPLLVSATHKPFGQFLEVLMATLWQEDEL